MSKEVKKITLGSIFSWIFGILFLLSGVGVIGSGAPIAGIIIILCSAMIIPYFNRLLAEKLNFKISGGVKFLLVIIIFIAMGFGMANTSSEVQKASNQQQSTPTNTETLTESQPSTEAQKPQKTYITKTYDDLWSVFSPNSDYTDLQKEKIFDEQYKGKYVKWTGRVKDVDASILDNLRLYIEHRNKADFDWDGGDVTLYMNKDQYDKLIELKKGDEVSYSAKFKSFGDIMSVSFYLEDGELIS